MKKENPEAALSFFAKATAAKGDVRIAYLDMGTIYTRQKRYGEAIVALQRAAKLDPSQPDAHYRLARVYQQMGKAAESQRELALVGELQEKADDLVRKMSASPPPLH